MARSEREMNGIRAMEMPMLEITILPPKWGAFVMIGSLGYVPPQRFFGFPIEPFALEVNSHIGQTHTQSGQ
jgi:hypothetical protein